MGSLRDVTDRFREAVRSVAVNEGFDDEKLAKISSSLIMHNSLPRSAFTRTAIEIHGNIREMHAFILKHRKDYSDHYRSTEKDRDNIEHEVGLFVKACRESVDALKDSIGVEEKKTEKSGWLSAMSRSTLNKDLNAHQHGMVLILSEYLHAVTTQFDQLRAGRFQEAIDKRMPKRRRGLEGINPASAVNTETNSESSSSADRQNFQSKGNERFQSQQLLDDETRTLQVELTNMMDTVQDTERKMLEVSALNHLFSTHVLKQAQQIEKLYQQALDATQNVDKGNLELVKAIQRSSSSRLYILLVVIVLSFGLLFLDWYE
ncbi:unnamed protein product [Calypogeia fissa]